MAVGVGREIKMPRRPFTTTEIEQLRNLLEMLDEAHEERDGVLLASGDDATCKATVLAHKLNVLFNYKDMIVASFAKRSGYVDINELEALGNS